MTETASGSGHRARLRARFLASPATLSDAELLELLLTFAIPRRDVAPLAQRLLAAFGDLDSVIAARPEKLSAVEGIGEATAVLLALVHRLHARIPSGEVPLPKPDAAQPALFQLPSEPAEAPEVRTYANDEVANALTFLPQAARFESLAAFKQHLQASLPYNSESTRVRRANYILNRYYPDERLDTPLTYYAARCSEAALGPVLFYHVLKAEPLARQVAEDLVWPALPVGHIEREALRAFLRQSLPDIKPASERKIVQALLNTYPLLPSVSVDDARISFRLQSGELPAFLYVLLAEFPEPGIYPFGALEQGPLHRWLLWDRAWMRRQLYNLRDLGTIAKVSEIDTVRQFTLALDPQGALKHYFETADREAVVLRERPNGGVP